MKNITNLLFLISLIGILSFFAIYPSPSIPQPNRIPITSDLVIDCGALFKNASTYAINEDFRKLFTGYSYSMAWITENEIQDKSTSMEKMREWHSKVDKRANLFRIDKEEEQKVGSRSMRSCSLFAIAVKRIRNDAEVTKMTNKIISDINI